jgi:hypothetical protein
VTDPGVLAWPDLRDWLTAEPSLLPAGDPAVPLLFVDLDTPGTPAQAAALLQAITPTPATTPATLSWSTTVDHRVLVGLARHAVRPELIPLTEALTCTLVAGGQEPVPAAQIAVPKLGPASRAIAATAAAAPKAAATLAGLLRLTSDIGVEQGLVAESLAYSMLLAGPEFARWRAARPARR